MQYAGFACTPLLGGYLSYVLGDRVLPVVGNIIVLNEFTAPSFALVGAGILSMNLLYFIFQDGENLLCIAEIRIWVNWRLLLCGKVGLCTHEHIERFIAK